MSLSQSWVPKTLVGDGFRYGHMSYFWPSRYKGEVCWQTPGKVSLALKKRSKQDITSSGLRTYLMIEYDVWTCTSHSVTTQGL